MSRNTGSNFLAGFGLIWLIFIIALAVGWILNINNVLKHYPPIKEWQAPQVVCTVGILALPIGGICGLVDGGLPNK